MANCKTCGEKAGALKSECDSCKTTRTKQEQANRLKAQEAENERQTQERLRLQAELEARYKAYNENCFANFDLALESEVTPYIYQYVLVESVSYLNGEIVGSNLALDNVQSLAQRGWEVVALHQITEGHGLQNTASGSVSGTTWGAGIGGLVVGAYVIMRLPLNKKILSQRRAEVTSVLDFYFPG